MVEPPRSDPPGRSGRWGPSIGYLVVALGLVAGVLAAWWPSTGGTPPAGPQDVAAAAASAPAAASAALPTRVAVATATSPASAPEAATAASRIPRVRAGRGDQTPDITDYINDGERPTMTDVITRLHDAGVHTGLGAFSPPGTRPPLVGLAVPEDFALPPGYVRHYQATDDGQRIEPILMFAPDFQAVGADGRPVAMPADRVVPPELAPAGLPIRRIVVPAPIASQ